jgi:hypothetical protein
MPNFHENDLLLDSGGDLIQPAEVDDSECFEPFVPQRSVSPAHNPAQLPRPPALPRLVDEFIRDMGYLRTPADAPPETGFPAPASDIAEVAQPSETLSAPVKAPLSPPREATAVELFTWIKRTLLALTHLPEDAAEVVAFWVISTWFPDALTVFPCLVISGCAHDAGVLLHVLRDFCARAALLAGFRRRDLGVLRRYQTRLVWEPNLHERTANLLSNLTDPSFLVAEGGSLACYSGSTAIYVGENPRTHNIQNSIHIYITPTNAAPPASHQWLQKTIERVPVHLRQYREKNLSYVHNSTWFPSGVSSEMAAIATAIGRCIVDAPELQQKLVALMKTLDQQHRSEMSNSIEAIVVEAIQALNRGGRERAYVRETAAEVNRHLEARGETARLTPEKVGHVMKKLGLRTRRLSQAGNGLTYDNATVARIQQVAAVYVMEDLSAET